MTQCSIGKKNLSDLFHQNKENVLVNQILSGNVFMTAEDDHPIKIKDVDMFSSKDKLQSLIWNESVTIKKLYLDPKTNYIVSEVYLDDKPLVNILVA